MVDFGDYPYPSQRMPVLAANIVATSQPLAAQAGLRMLAQGGNAVDAALAVAITLTVVEPTGCGIGSDAFAIVWDGETLSGLNGSGRSPAAWHPEQFAHLSVMPDLGWESVTVPGAVDLWVSLSKRFGRLPFGDLFQPAIRYARDGFAVTPRIAAHWADAPQRFSAYPEMGTVFLPNGCAPLPGETFRCAAQADTLAEIAATKGRSFYSGRLAKAIAEHASSTGGQLTVEDLAAHRSDWVTPLACSYHGIELHEIPPNGQGLAAMIALGILRHLEIGQTEMDSADSIHLQIEAMKIAIAESFVHIADPEHMRITPQHLLSDKRLARQAARIDRRQARIPAPVDPNPGGTVFMAAADADGMMVSLIQSNYIGFGSGIVVPQTGISLQSRARGFSLVADHPNRVDGGKRPFHTIIPGFVTRDGEPLMCLGVMGGHMQPQGHVQMLVRMTDYGLNPQAALDAPRWHVTEDFGLALESGIAPKVVQALQERGHRIVTDPPQSLFGGGQIIMRLKDGYCAGSDPRKDGQAVGF